MNDFAMSHGNHYLRSLQWLAIWFRFLLPLATGRQIHRIFALECYNPKQNHLLSLEGLNLCFHHLQTSCKQHYIEEHFQGVTNTQVFRPVLMTAGQSYLETRSGARKQIKGSRVGDMRCGSDIRNSLLGCFLAQDCINRRSVLVAHSEHVSSKDCNSTAPLRGHNNFQITVYIMKIELVLVTDPF